METSPRPARRRLARLVSIVGHPALITPAAGLAAMARGGAGAPAVGSAAAILALIVLAVMGYGYRQVRRGGWEHIDASRPLERRSHNLVGLGALAAGAVLAALSGFTPVAAGLGAAALVMAAAVALSPWLKLSQHVAFAVLAGVLAFTVTPWAAIAAAPLIALLAWSRLELGRHTLAEVAAGGAIGLAAGLALLGAIART